MLVYRLRIHCKQGYGPCGPFNVQAWTARGAIKKAKRYWPFGFDHRYVLAVTYQIVGFNFSLR